MTFRRLVACLTMLLMTHLAVARPATACTRHDLAAGSSATRQHVHPSTHAPRSPEHPHAPTPAPCNHSTGPECCPAAMGCSVAVAMPSEMSAHLTDMAARQVHPSASGSFVVPASGPEPPPPKLQVLTI